ncbi:MAG TPA: DUF2807 domain-containing protein [Anaerolineales bacterium]
MERRYNLFWPLALIAAGVIWILIDMGTIPVSNLWVLTYLWPVLLIGAGLSILLRPYWRYAGAVISLLMIAGLFLAVLFAGQLGWDRVPGYTLNGSSIFAGPGARGSGNVVSQTRAVQGFTGIRVAYPASVVIRQAAGESLTVEAEDNVAAEIKTQVANGTLVIGAVHEPMVLVDPTRPVRITITVKDLDELDFDTAGDVTVQGLKTKSLTTVLDGAGSATLNNLDLESLTANLSGVGSLRANGTVNTVTVRVDGVGSFDAAALRSQTAIANLSGMGSASLWVQKALTATVSGVGSVNYYGNPQVSQTISGLGNVHSMGSK